MQNIEDKNLINSLRISAPCPVAWDAMDGDSTVRHCGQCKLNVYNVSEMSDDEAVELIQNNENKRLCIKLYRRWDGTVATNNCPVGLRWTRRVVKVGVICLIAGIVWAGCMDEVSAQELVRTPVDGKGFRLEGIPHAHPQQASKMHKRFHHDDTLVLKFGAAYIVALMIYLRVKKKQSILALGLIFICCFAVAGYYCW